MRNFFLLHLCLKSSLSTNKECEKKYKKFYIFRLFRLNFEGATFKKKFEEEFLKCIL